MAASKSGGSWASALKQPRSTSASQSQSRQPSGTATPVSSTQQHQQQPSAAAATPAPADARAPAASSPASATAASPNTHKPAASTSQAQASTSSSSPEKPSDPLAAALNQGDYTRLLGSQIELTMNDDKKHTGYIYAFDSVMAVAVLSSQPCPQPGIAASYHILKSTEVKHVRVLSAAEAQTEGGAKHWKPPRVHLDRIASNVDKAVKADQQRQARLGKGVSPIAQDIFDALSKTLPTAWVGQNIQVLDDIVISGPEYDASSTAFKPDAANPSSDQQQTKMQRLLKVLTGVRHKIVANGGGTSSNSTANGTGHIGGSAQ